MLALVLATGLATAAAFSPAGRAPVRGRAPSPAMSDDLFLGIDCGTQGLKAVVYDAVGKATIGVGSVAYGLLPSTEVGCAEQDPAVWVGAMHDAAAQGTSAASTGACVRGVGVSGQQHGLVALDEAYGVIRPAKLWCDTQSAPEAVELAARLGWGIVAGFTSTKLLWLKRHEPEAFGRLAHIALPHDYLNWVLTGELVMECGEASGTGLLDPESRAWDGAAAAMVDAALLGKLPPLIGPCDAAGALQPAAAAALGVPAGVPVSAGGGDNMMSALGCGVSVEGRVAISLGTSGTLFAKAPSAARDASGAICPFFDATGGGLPLMCTLNAAGVPEEVRAGYGLPRDEIGALAAAEPAGCEGLSMLPFLAGERTPNWPHASGALVGLRAGHLARPGLLYRAALEGVAFSLRGGIAALRKHGVPEVREVRLVGGGAKSALWRAVIADALQVRVVCPASPESAARGAALQAAAHVYGVPADRLGEWAATEHAVPLEASVEPDPAAAAAYDGAYALYEGRARALFAEG